MGISIDEKRVYDASEGPTPVYVVGDLGVARVDTSDDLVGEFGLAHRCTARDAAGRDGRLAVATDEDVLVGVFGDSDEEAVTFRPLGVGPTVAVGLGEGGVLLVAREEGTVVRGNAAVGGENESDWTELGELDDVRAIDGDFVAAESGVYRATDDGLRHVGLDSARDVSTDGVPLAATDGGLYRLGNGWLDERDGTFRAVGAAASSAGELGWAHAAGEGVLLGHDDGEWREVELPVKGEIVALDHGEEGAYAVTADGTFLLSVGDGWNHQILGIRGVRAVAAPQ
ncbi:HVO_0234 family beta-propeller protein [Halorussus lipolyticus]|uniref:HVO_0234 family beta-propeller protein n=1 Tax=Halorussus lipolyticus TaxID=3034024 RepID=UPI0023E75F20|nr:hypothetical protein [Halorussus sp. DT80]